MWARRTRRATVTGATIGALVLALSGTAGAIRVAYTATSSPSVGSNFNVLNGVSEAPGTAFAAGFYYNGTTDRSLIEQWKGSQWNVMTSDNNGTEQNQLNGIAAVSATSAFAVGAYYNFASWLTLGEVWNGSTWKVVYTPTISPHDNWLEGVAASSSSNAWAVGYYLQGSIDAQRTLIEHWNGSKWSIVASPNVGNGDNYLLRVAVVPGTNGTEAWAVGYYNKGKISQNLVEHLSDGVWSVVTVPEVGPGNNWIHSVSALSAKSAYIVGWSYNSALMGRTLVERWNGTSWKVVPSANIGPLDNNFKAVVEQSPTNVTAFGYYLNGTHVQTLVEHLRRGQFVVVPSGDASPYHNNLLDASYLPGQPLFSVGLYNNGTSYRTLVETCASCA
jgi:hypothetical protein